MKNPRTHSSQNNAASRHAAFAWITLPWGIWREYEKLNPTDLFKACEVQENRFKTINGKQFLDSLDRMRLFEGPVFSEESESRARKAHEFGLLITPPRSAKADWRYTELVRKLKNLHQPDLRWLLIARWLESEGVCKAEEFLPKDTLKRFLKRAKKERLEVFASDLQIARLVRIWIPYFERLLHNRKELRKKRRGVVTSKDLLEMGYLESAVEATYGKQEPVPAIITWLTLREEKYPAKEGTLRSAYSRVEIAEREAETRFDKLLSRHPRQIDPWEYHNFLQLIS